MIDSKSSVIRDVPKLYRLISVKDTEQRRRYHGEVDHGRRRRRVWCRLG